MNTANLQIRIPQDLRDEAADVLDSLGMDMSSAIRVYLKKIVNTRRIPFAISAEADVPGQPEYVSVDEKTQKTMDEIGALWQTLKTAKRTRS